MRTRVKICGITTLDDARAAVAAGADALGFVFYGPSSRYIAPEAAGEIIRALPAFVTAVAVVVDLSPAELDNIAYASGTHYFQFHGDEDPRACRAAGLPFLKALRVRRDTDIRASAERYAEARGLLLDAFIRDLPGGTGRTFDWSRVPESLPVPVFLSGGLTVDNVAEAIHTVHPFGVDVSSGVEQSPGVKDPDRIARFMDAARAADSQRQHARRTDS